MAVSEVDTLLIPPEELDIEELDAAVDAAIRSGEPAGLRVLGYGEVTLVLGWPTAEPTLAVKRLPLFRDNAQLERYRDLLSRYTTELEARGVRVAPTEVRHADSPDGTHVYLVQPFVERSEFLNHVLRAADQGRGEDLLGTLVEVVSGAVDERVGLDAQAANWAVRGDALFDVDVSTPMLRVAGRHELDLSLFVSIYPSALRRVLLPVGHSVMSQFHAPRGVLVDVASNLVKERLDRWLPALLSAANGHVEPAITDVEVRRYFTRDRRLWLLLQRLRRLDRSWQRRVRHRQYPFLLAPPYHYGPQELR